MQVKPSSAVPVWNELTADGRATLLDDPDPEVRRSAALCACPHDARLTAELLGDPAALPELASSAGANSALPPGEMAVVMDEAKVPA